MNSDAEATDWRKMFGRYLEIVGEAEGYTFIKETDWSAEELAEIRKLEDETQAPALLNPAAIRRASERR